MREAAVAGIGRTAFTKCSGRTPLAMATEATRAALDDAGLRPADVDGIIDFSTGDSASGPDVRAGGGRGRPGASVPAFAQLVPYVIALVEFDEGPRLPGILLGERGPGVAIGQRVRAELTLFPGAAERAITFRRAELP